MTNSKWRVWLFTDNAGVHNIPDVCLSSTQIVFVPKNTKSCLQPQDAGVIQGFKLNYRQHLHNIIMNRMTDEATLSNMKLHSFSYEIAQFEIFLGFQNTSFYYENEGQTPPVR